MGGKLKLSKEDRLWAAQVKERDNWQCVVCGDKARLNAHHIIPREVAETKYNLTNGLSLCPKHHFFSRLISAHNNPLALFCWLELHRPEQLHYLKDIIKEIGFNDGGDEDTDGYYD